MPDLDSLTNYLNDPEIYNTLLEASETNVETPGFGAVVGLGALIASADLARDNSFIERALDGAIDTAKETAEPLGVMYRGLKAHSSQYETGVPELPKTPLVEDRREFAENVSNDYPGPEIRNNYEQPE